MEVGRETFAEPTKSAKHRAVLAKSVVNGRLTRGWRACFLLLLYPFMNHCSNLGCDTRSLTMALERLDGKDGSWGLPLCVIGM